jgi:hypothetical protein
MLKFLNVANASEPENEVLNFVVAEKCNLAEYGIVDKTFDKTGKESNVHRHIYRFPSVVVEKGERVRLRNGVGTDRKGLFTTPEGQVTGYEFFWNMESCVWNDKGDTALLIKYHVMGRITIPKLEPKK